MIIGGLSKIEAIGVRENCIRDIERNENTYYRNDFGAPNFFKRINYDRRSVVLGNYEQYNYYPWNEESNWIFMKCAEPIDIWLNECFKQNFWNDRNEERSQITKNGYGEEFFIRIAYQRFKEKTGFLEIHKDPTGEYQNSAPIISLTERDEIVRGGLYYTENGEIVEAQKEMGIGECIMFDNGKLHGVGNVIMNERKWLEHLLLVMHATNKSKNYKTSSR